MTDGGQAVTFIHECILQLLPFTTDKRFERELLNTLPFGDSFFSQETVKCRWFAEINDGCIAFADDLCLLSKILLKHLVDHLLKGYATQTVIRVDATIRGDGEVQQQRRVAAH